MQSRQVRGPVIAILALAGASCGLGGEFARLQVSPSEVTLRAGESVQFAALARRSDGSAATPPDVRWSASVGTIDTSGRYTAPERVGTATVTARLGALAAVAKVEVRLPPPSNVARLEVRPREAIVQVEQPRRFTAVATNAEGKELAVEIKWGVKGIGRISPNGVFRAGEKGVATVTARVPRTDAEAAAKVTVTEAVTAAAHLEVRPRRLLLRPGSIARFEAVGYGLDMRRVPCTVVWSATGGEINPRGVYIPGSKPGRYQVTARVPGADLKATATIEIRE
jgi:hypothetical protein